MKTYLGNKIPLWLFGFLYLGSVRKFLFVPFVTGYLLIGWQVLQLIDFMKV